MMSVHNNQHVQDTNTGSQDGEIDPSTFPNGVPTMPGWRGQMWAQQGGQAAQQYQQQQQAQAQGQAGQPQYAPGQQQYNPAAAGQYPQQQQYPGQQQQYAAAAAYPGQQQQFYDPSQQQQQPLAPYYPSAQSPSSASTSSMGGGYASSGSGGYAAPGAYAQQQQYPQAGYDQSMWNPGMGMMTGGLQMSQTGGILGMGDKPVPPQRACKRCKRLKVRCENVNGERPCKRCRNANAECETAQRKQRPKKADKEAAARRAAEEAAGHRVGDTRGRAEVEGSEESEESEEESEEEESPESNLPTDAGSHVKPPFDYIREGARKRDQAAATAQAPPIGAPLSPDSEKNKDGKAKDKVGVRAGYFNSSSAASLPLANVPGADKLEILGVLTSSEVDMMFKLFMDNINPYMSMFDEKLHTVEYLKTRSPFLLTVITMIASRYYTKRPDAYVRIMEIAKKLAGEAIIEMAQSIEHCQAFILLASYPAPDRKYSENKNWIYSGVAFRMATDIGLYKPQQLPAANEQLEREALNRTRTWIVCFYLDESMSAHFGRPATISRDDPVVKNSLNWWKTNSNRYGHLHDVHLVLFVDLLRAFRTALDKGQEEEGKEVDHDKICREFDAEVAELVTKGETIYREATDRNKPVCILRERMGDFTTVYSRLIIYSTAFQNGNHKTPEQEQECLQNCLDSAFRVLDILMNELASTGLLRYAPDGYFWYASFASAFLLKFLGPEHHDKVDDETRNRITSRVRELIDILGSRAVAVDGSHPPKLFSRFLSGMLNKHVKLAQRAASNAGSNAPTPQHDAIAASGSEAGHTDGPVSPVNTILSSEDRASTPATSPVTSISLPPSQSQPQQWPQPSQPTQPQGTLYGTGFDEISFSGVDRGLATAEGWGPAQDALMQDVDVQELHTGMFILDHPPWWNDPSLGIDLATLGMGGQTAGGTAGGGMDFAAGGAAVGHNQPNQFSAYDAAQYGA